MNCWGEVFSNPEATEPVLPSDPIILGLRVDLASAEPTVEVEVPLTEQQFWGKNYGQGWFWWKREKVEGIGQGQEGRGEEEGWGSGHHQRRETEGIGRKHGGASTKGLTWGTDFRLLI